jgi:integrase
MTTGAGSAAGWRPTEADLWQYAVDAGVCGRPVIRRCTDRQTGESDIVPIWCGSTREGVKRPRRRKVDTIEAPITRTQLRERLLPAVTPGYRFIVASAAGCGLRWGEAAGLVLDALDVDGGTLRVVEEVDGLIRLKPYPKSESGRRTVPLPPLVLDVLAEHRALMPMTR